MDPLLRAAVDRRDREQGVSGLDEFEAADAARRTLLDEQLEREMHCAGCQGPLRENSKTGFCSRNAECVRKARASSAARARKKARS